MVIAKYLWESGSVIITVLGSLHLYYTFFSDKFSSRNKEMVEAMKTSFPNISKDMTMWKAWISFNATHSTGAMFLGIINFYMAVRYFEILINDHFFFLFSLITSGFYVWLALKYWFKTIQTGVMLVFLCYLISYILVLINF